MPALTRRRRQTALTVPFYMADEWGKPDEWVGNITLWTFLSLLFSGLLARALQRSSACHLPVRLMPDARGASATCCGAHAADSGTDVVYRGAGGFYMAVLRLYTLVLVWRVAY